MSEAPAVAPITDAWPDPTPAMLDGDPLFDAIWQAIKSWDINVPHAYAGYCHATGNHARAIYDAIAPQTEHDHRMWALANVERTEKPHVCATHGAAYAENCAGCAYHLGRSMGQVEAGAFYLHTEVMDRFKKPPQPIAGEPR